MTPMLMNLALIRPDRREPRRYCDACALVVFLDQPAGGDDRG
ncbi:hypothetical protein [Micromonospora sp. Llam0]|nr:hypothetical protein [Micromonospora sp. Llam0]